MNPSPLQRLVRLASNADTGTRAWLQTAVQNWLNGDELSALGLTGSDRQAVRLSLRNRHIRAAWSHCPGERFSIRFSALLAACERLNRVRQGYRHQRQDSAIFDALEAAAQWAELPAGRQLRNVICENGGPLELHETDCIINLKSLIQDIDDECLSAGTD